MLMEGESCLMCKRLIINGVRFIEVSRLSWYPRVGNPVIARSSVALSTLVAR